MNRWEVIGKYLGREIKTSEVSVNPPFQFASIESSVLLLFLKVAMPLESVRMLLKALIAQQPLVIVVHGIQARAAFELLISELSESASEKHVMTKVLEHHSIDKAVEDLLHSTWPSEDRFDDWMQYALVNVGGDSMEVEKVVKKLCG